MKWNNLFRINVGFLIHEAVGTYREFEIESPDLTIEEGFEIENVRCTVRVSRVQQGLLASVHTTAEKEMDCVRCLEPFSQKIDTSFDELFAFHLRQNSDAELFLPENGIMDLLPILREYLLLEIPICPVCKPDCKGLCVNCGANLNIMTCEHQKP
ncbi:MAG: DUF177 domain-containing protein [Flexilinea sp.]|jgi:uncharacterized protein